MRLSQQKSIAALAIAGVTLIGLTAFAFGQLQEPKPTDDTPASPVEFPILRSLPRTVTAQHSASAPTVPPCVIPSDVEDPPFDRHIDLLMLGQAWDFHDA